MSYLPLPIEELVPHRAPMLLLDRVMNVTETTVVAEFTVRSDMPLLNAQGDLPAWVGIEIMAQTIAAWSGYQERIAGFEPQIGFLLGTRKYDTNVSAFSSGAVLHVTAELVFRDGPMGVFDCAIACDDAVIASARLTTYQPDPEKLEKMKRGEE
jgi:predicted hotdog family 3-hydroxylacyl-ACP dehydratase